MPSLGLIFNGTSKKIVVVVAERHSGMVACPGLVLNTGRTIEVWVRDESR